MNIVYVTNSRFPSERAHMIQIVHMCNSFTLQSNHVTLVVTNRSTDIVETAEAYYGTSINFQVVKKPVFSTAQLAGKLPRFAANVLYMCQRISFALSARQLCTKTDILYGRDEWILWFFSWFVPVERIVLESHQAKFTYPAKKLFQKGVKCVVISEGIRDFYVSEGVPTSQLLVAHDGIKMSHFLVMLKQQRRLARALDYMRVNQLSCISVD